MSNTFIQTKLQMRKITHTHKAVNYYTKTRAYVYMKKKGKKEKDKKTLNINDLFRKSFKTSHGIDVESLIKWNEKNTFARYCMFKALFADIYSDIFPFGLSKV